MRELSRLGQADIEYNRLIRESFCNRLIDCVILEASRMTIKEVADKAGVSTATVSRMINENGFVSDETRQKIRLAIKETGYKPSLRKRRQSNSVSSRLRHSNVVMVWTTDKYRQLSHTGQDMMRGSTEALQKMGAGLTVAHIKGGSKEIPPFLLSGKTDGILIHGSTPSATVCKHLKKFPVVWLLQRGSVDFGDRVQPDHAHAGTMSFDYLASQGCRNLCCISYIPASPHFEYWKSRADSFSSHAEMSGVPCNLLVHPEPNESNDIVSDRAAAAASLVKSFSRLDPKPDGLFVANDLGPYVHAELLRYGIVPMKDVLMIAGDGNLCSRYHMDPKPVTIRIFSQQIGSQAIELLLQRINNPSMPQVTCLLKPQLILPAQNGIIQ